MWGGGVGGLLFGFGLFACPISSFYGQAIQQLLLFLSGEPANHVSSAPLPPPPPPLFFPLRPSLLQKSCQLCSKVVWCMVVWCTQNLRRGGSSFMWHQPCQRCKYTTTVDIQKRAVKSYSLMSNHIRAQ